MKLKYYLRGLGIGVVVAALLMGFTKGGKKEAMTDEEIIARAQQLGMVESSVLSSDLGNDTEEVAQEENQANDNTVSDDELVVAIAEDTEEKETQEAEEKAAKEAEEKAAKEAEEKAKKEAEEKAKKEAEEKAAKEAEEKAKKEAEEKAKKEAEEKAKKEAEEKAKKEAEEKAAKEAASKNESGNYIVTVYGGDGSRAVANRLEEMGAIKNAAAFDDFLCKHGYDRKLTTGKHEIKAGSSEQEIAEALMKKPQ